VAYVADWEENKNAAGLGIKKLFVACCGGAAPGTRFFCLL
jgi:hypothetical protein